MADQPLQLFFGASSDRYTAGSAAATGKATEREKRGGSGDDGSIVDLPVKSKGSLTGASPAKVLRWRQEVDDSKFLKVGRRPPPLW